MEDEIKKAASILGKLSIKKQRSRIGKKRWLERMIKMAKRPRPNGRKPRGPRKVKEIVGNPL